MKFMILKLKNLKLKLDKIPKNLDKIFDLFKIIVLYYN